MAPLDALDSLILDELQLDGRLTNIELGSRVGLSPSATLRRVRRLEDEGVIDRYVMLIDPAAIGLTTSVFVEISLTGQRDDQLDSFEAAIADCPGLMSCHLMTGDFDYLVHLMCTDAAEYERIHRSHLARLPGVTRIKTSFALRAVLDRTAHPLAGPATARS